VVVSRERLGGRRSECLRPASAAEGVVLYLHGGGFTTSSPRTHRGLTGRLAAASGAVVHALAYRRAPEAVFPAAHDDAFDAYCALVDAGNRPEHIVLAGDSAGGGIALSTAVRLRDSGLPGPVGLILISPWVDLTCAEAARWSDRDDALASWPSLRRAARHYAGSTPLDDPRLSPLFADLLGLPPALVTTCSVDTLRRDAERLVERMRGGGGQSELDLAPGLWHDAPVHAGLVARATGVATRLGHQIRAWTAPSVSPPS
jgi:acetyl esterase/lipase